MKRLIFCGIFLLLTVGCGVYSFKGQGIANIKSVAVEPFENRTAEFGIRELVTDAVVSRLLADRTLTVASPRNADALLSGTIVSIDEKPLTFHADETVTEYQVTIVLDVKLVKQGVAEPLWQGQLVGIGTYPYKVGTPDGRKDGINKAVDKVVEDLLNRLTSDW